MDEEYSPRRKFAILVFVSAVSWFALIGFVLTLAAIWETLA